MPFWLCDSSCVGMRVVELKFDVASKTETNTDKGELAKRISLLVAMLLWNSDKIR